MKKIFIILGLIFVWNYGSAQGMRLYTGLTTFKNNSKSVHSSGHAQHGYVIGLDGKLNDGFAIVFGAKFSSIKVAPSNSWNHFSAGGNISMISGKFGFDIPIYPVNDFFKFRTSIAGVATKIMRYDTEKMKRAYNELIQEVHLGLEVGFAVDYKSYVFSILGEQQFTNAFSADNSRYRVYTLTAGLFF